MVGVSAEILKLPDLFDDNGELRIAEYEDGWTGFRRRDGRYFFVDTRRPEGDWLREIIVGPRAVRESVERHLRGGPA